MIAMQRKACFSSSRICDIISLAILSLLMQKIVPSSLTKSRRVTVAEEILPAVINCYGASSRVIFKQQNAKPACWTHTRKPWTYHSHQSEASEEGVSGGVCDCDN